VACGGIRYYPAIESSLYIWEISVKFEMPRNFGRNAVIAVGLASTLVGCASVSTGSNNFASPPSAPDTSSVDSVNPGGQKIAHVCVVADLDKTAIVETENGDMYQVNAEQPPSPDNYFYSWTATITASLEGGNALIFAQYDRHPQNTLTPYEERGLRITGGGALNGNTSSPPENTLLSRHFAFREAARYVQDYFYNDLTLIQNRCDRNLRLDRATAPIAQHGSGFKKFLKTSRAPQ
jgi:hypothetical protein